MLLIQLLATEVFKLETDVYVVFLFHSRFEYLGPYFRLIRIFATSPFSQYISWLLEVFLCDIIPCLCLGCHETAKV